MDHLTDLATAADALARPPLGDVGDDELLRLQERLAGIARRLNLAAAEVAAEIGTRSARELGYAGLAQRLGARTPERLVQQLMGTTAGAARTLVETGRMLAADTAGEAPDPLAQGLLDGTLSVEQARAIRVGLGEPSERVDSEKVDAARAVLAELATGITVEELRAHARVLRDELDASGVPEREGERHERRFLRLIPQEDGMTRLIGLLDPESTARVRTIIDAVLSPRRAGPRFVAVDVDGDGETSSDLRTEDQLALDALIDVLEVGAAVDEANGGALLGRNGAPVIVVAAARDLASGDGAARIEGEDASVSIATARRRACAFGSELVVFDTFGRRALDLGRSRRIFSAHQRTVLHARDGGCRGPGCRQPGRRTEAHHLVHWQRGGTTDIDNAISLCRYHHLLVHNNGWEIEKDELGRFWFVPPPDVDPLRRRIAAASHNPVLRRLSA